MKTELRGHPPAAETRALRRCRALTRLEVLVILVVLVLLTVLGVMAVTALSAARRLARGIECANNLKSVGLCFKQFATDNGDESPQSLSTNHGGVKELVNIGPGGAGDPTRTFWVFAAMSNELVTPKILRCPADRNRTVSSNFYGMAFATPLAQGGQNASVSYFVNLNASEQQPKAILCGDRNLSTVTKAKRASDYDEFFRLEHRIRPADVKPGGTYAHLDFQPSLHRSRGNVVLTDGSLQPVIGVELQDRILVSTNELRLIFPFVPGKNE